MEEKYQGSTEESLKKQQGNQSKCVQEKKQGTREMSMQGKWQGSR